MKKQSFHTSREALIRRLKDLDDLKGEKDEEKSAPIIVEGKELIDLHNRIEKRCTRNMEEIIGSWAQAKNEDGVIK